MDRAVLYLPNGRVFTIVADNLSATNGYVGVVRLNGKPLQRTFIRHEEIMAGGELHFTMQSGPNKSWGVDPAARPYSMSAYQR